MAPGNIDMSIITAKRRYAFGSTRIPFDQKIPYLHGYRVLAGYWLIMLYMFLSGLIIFMKFSKKKKEKEKKDTVTGARVVV